MTKESDRAEQEAEAISRVADRAADLLGEAIEALELTGRDRDDAVRALRILEGGAHGRGDRKTAAAVEMSASRKKRRAAAGWCVANGIEPGATIEVLKSDGWVLARVTGLGESAILLRRKGCAEFAHSEPTKVRLITKGDDR